MEPMENAPKATGYERALGFLRSKGMKVIEAKKKPMGLNMILEYPFGQKKVEVRLFYHSFFHSLRAEFHIPYSPVDKELQEEYDRVFASEKNAWGKSSPKFEQAIVDYMRGQAHSGTTVELRDHKKELFISFGVAVNGRKEEGLLEGLGKVSFEMRQGMIHGDVLFHMFAY